MADPRVCLTDGGLNVLIREPRESDQGYVASTWVESLCKADHDANRAGLGFLIDGLLDHQGVRVILACEPSVSNTILGWLCYTPMKAIRLIHYAYVRAGLRDRGIAGVLRAEAGLSDVERTLVYTMRGPCFKSLIRKYPDAIESPIKEFLS